MSGNDLRCSKPPAHCEPTHPCGLARRPERAERGGVRQGYLHHWHHGSPQPGEGATESRRAERLRLSCHPVDLDARAAKAQGDSLVHPLLVDTRLRPCENHGASRGGRTDRSVSQPDPRDLERGYLRSRKPRPVGGGPSPPCRRPHTERRSSPSRHTSRRSAMHTAFGEAAFGCLHCSALDSDVMSYTI